MGQLLTFLKGETDETKNELQRRQKSTEYPMIMLVSDSQNKL